MSKSQRNVRAYLGSLLLLLVGGISLLLYLAELSADSENLVLPLSGQREQVETLVKGAEIYRRNCVSCHGSHGEGGVGSNLTDDVWKHGGSPSQIRETIANGVVEKGMLAWSRYLKPQEIDQVTAFVVSL